MLCLKCVDSWLKGHFSDWDAFRCCETQLFCAADCKKHRFPESPGNQTKWLVFRMIPVKDSLQPTAQSLVLAWTFLIAEICDVHVQTSKNGHSHVFVVRTHAPSQVSGLPNALLQMFALKHPQSSKAGTWKFPSSVHLLCPLLCMLNFQRCKNFTHGFLVEKLISKNSAHSWVAGLRIW